MLRADKFKYFLSLFVFLKFIILHTSWHHSKHVPKLEYQLYKALFILRPTIGQPLVDRGEAVLYRGIQNTETHLLHRLATEDIRAVHGRSRAHHFSQSIGFFRWYARHDSNVRPFASEQAEFLPTVPSVPLCFNTLGSLLSLKKNPPPYQFDGF